MNIPFLVFSPSRFHWLISCLLLNAGLLLYVDVVSCGSRLFSCTLNCSWFGPRCATWWTSTWQPGRNSSRRRMNSPESSSTSENSLILSPWNEHKLICSVFRKKYVRAYFQIPPDGEFHPSCWKEEDDRQTSLWRRGGSVGAHVGHPVRKVRSGGETKKNILCWMQIWMWPCWMHGTIYSSPINRVMEKKKNMICPLWQCQLQIVTP